MKRILILTGLMLFMGFSLFAQSIRVTGTVTSQTDGSTIPGVSVLVRGTTVGTVTDINGRYELQAPSNGALIFSFIGFLTREVAIQGREVINVSLEEEIFEIEGVIVTALGISRERRALSYSVQGVSGDDIAEVKDANLVNSLSGKVAGVQVTNASGAIGSSSRIIIRGNSSFGDNQPLFVIDGTPVSNFATSVDQYGGVDYGNAIMDLDPANIQSISVLKGGMAAALYGQQASNGVILITTKGGGGRSANLGVNVTSAVTFENPYIFPDYQNEYGQGYNGSEFLYQDYLAAQGLTEAEYSYQQYAYDRSFRYKNGAGAGRFDGVDESWGPRLDIGLMLPQFNSPYTLDANGNPVYESTPWISHPDNVKDFFNTGMTFDNNFEVYGSGDRTSARLGISSMNGTGTIPNTDLTRYSVMFNGDMDISPRFTANATINYVKNTSDNLPGGGYDVGNVMQSIGGWFGRQVDMQALEDNWDTKDPYGRWYNWNSNYHNNPFFTVNRLLRSRDRDRVFGNFMLTYKLTDWISLSGRIGNDFFSENRKEVNANGAIEVQPGGNFNINDRAVNLFSGDLFLNFDRKIGDDFRVDGLLGANYYQYDERYQYLGASSLTVPDLFTIGNVAGNPSTAMSTRKSVSNSLLGSVNISFRNYLFLNATGRNDWSSTLPKDAWSYFYPSVGLGLIFTDAFGIESDILSYGKIRGSWAQIGKATSPYQTRGVYIPGSSTFRNVTQFYIDRQLPPVGLKNETTTSYEFGLEMAFLMNRVNFDFTYFNNLSRDQILGVDISPASGYGSMLINAGEIQNKGVELLLNAGIIRNQNGFNWDVTLNWAYIDNLVNELYGDLEAYQLSGSWSGLSIEARPGKPFGTIMGKGYARDAQGRVIINPNTGIAMLTPVPIEIGNIMPDWTGGFRNTFSYKNLSLSMLIDARWGGDLFSITDWFGAYAGVAGYTTEDGVRENGVVIGTNRLQEWGAVLAATNENGVIIYDDDGYPVGSGVANDILVSAQDYYESTYGNLEASIIDGSFIKLREISFGYTIPRSIVNQIGFLRSAQISIIGRNLALLYTHESNDIHIDPETGFGTTNSGMGLEQYQLPSSRSIGFKINLGF